MADGGRRTIASSSHGRYSHRAALCRAAAARRGSARRRSRRPSCGWRRARRWPGWSCGPSEASALTATPAHADEQPMPRVMEIITPLGDDVLLFHGMHAREEMSRLFEYQLDLLSPKNDINLDDILGKNVTVKLALPDDSTRYFNGYVTRFSQGGTLRPLLPLSRDRAAVALVPHADRRLPDLPGDDRPGHRQEGVRRSRDGRLQVRADRQLPQVDLLRAVPRDRLQLRQPADGGGRHLLLLQAHRRPQHAGADRLDQQAHAVAGLRDRSRSSRPSSWCGRSSSTSAAGTSRARSSRASTCTTTTTSSGRASS